MKMLPLVVFLVLSSQALAATITTDTDIEECEFSYDKENYKRTAILTIKGLPTNLAYNPSNDELHFTLIDLDSLQDDQVQTKMDQYVFTNGEPIKIDNVNGQSAAVDVNNDKVYIATDDGVYTLNSTYRAHFHSFKEEDFVQLFKPNHSDELYGVVYPSNEVYVIDLKRNEKEKIDNIPCAYILAVDAEDNVYYECDSKYVKVLLQGFKEPIEFVGIAKDTARAIAVDPQNRVVLASNDGLYQLKPDNLIPKKLMDLEFMPSGLAFSGSDVFIATSGKIYRYSSC